MTLTVKHAFVSAVADAGVPGEIEPSHWNATHVVTGSLDPGVPVNSVQFNQPLGTFAGTGNFTWLTGPTTNSGLTIGGATISGGVITPGSGGEAAAIGKYAVINNALFAPGDPVNAQIFQTTAALTLCPLQSGDLSGLVSQTFTGYGGVIHTGAGQSFVTGLDVETTVNSNSTGPFGSVIGGEIGISNYGSGNITAFLEAAVIQANNLGSGNISTIIGLSCESFDQGSGGVTSQYGGQFRAQTQNVNSFADLTGGLFGVQLSGGTVHDLIGGEFHGDVSGTSTIFNNAYGIKVTGFVGTPIGQPHNVYGIYIAAASGGTTNNWNIWSIDQGSWNQFDGTVFVGNDLVVGSGTATNATNGFLYIDAGAGAPTGVPSGQPGTVPMYFDTANSQLWIYAAGAWRQPKTPGGAATVTWQ
jgi:hypothetical protein